MVKRTSLFLAVILLTAMYAFGRSQLLDINVAGKASEQSFGNGSPSQPWPDTSVVSAINYDSGGAGIGYVNAGGTSNPSCSYSGSYRPDTVNFKPSTAGVPFQIGCSVAGNSYIYTVRVSSVGPFIITAQLADTSAGGSWNVFLDNVMIGSIVTPGTGDFSAFQPATLSAPFNATPGNHTFRFTANGGDAFFNGSGDFLAFQISVFGVAPDPTAGLLTADRDFYPNWKMAGLLSLGGEPSRTTQCGSQVTPIGGGSDDTANIQAAVNACSPGQFVSLGIGTFTIAEGNTVTINQGITVRGAGAGQTTVQHPPGQDTSPTNNCGPPGAWGATLGSDCPGNHPSTIFMLGGTSGSIGTGIALTADAQKGSTTVTLASVVGISTGTLVHVDELALGQAMPDCCFNNGGGQVWAESDYRVEWNAHNPVVNFFDSADFSNDNNFTTANPNGDACAYSVRCGGVNEELHLVTAVNGNTVTFDSPVTLSYRVANLAQVRVISGVVQQAGLENLSVRFGDNGNVGFNYCVYCWATGVESTIWLNNGAFFAYKGAFRWQWDNNWAHNAAWPVSGGGGYALNMTFGASEGLITNNIVMLANKVIVSRASGAGTVISYNYMDDAYINGASTDTWTEIGVNCSHLAGSHGCLFEGNYTFNIDEDFTHGSSTHNTAFRNYASGFRAPFTALDGNVRNDLTGCCGPLRALADHGYGYWDSFIGNIAGTPNAVSSWMLRCASGGADSGCAPAIYNLGWNDSSVAGSLSDQTMELSYPTSPTGTNATLTGPGCVSSGSNCVPILDGNFDYKTNAIQWATNDTAHSLPPSFYLTTAPAFFSGGTWPPVNPINGTVASIPAHTRWTACQPSPTAACIFSTGTTIACDTGPAYNYNVSLPGPATKAGFNHCAANFNFAQTLPANFFGCYNNGWPTSGSTFYQVDNSVNNIILCGNNVGQAPDPVTGNLTWHIHWDSSLCGTGCTSTSGNAIRYAFQTQPRNLPTPDTTLDFPQGKYVEITFRFGQNGPYGFPNAFPNGFFEWSSFKTSGASTNSIERDWLEIGPDAGQSGGGSDSAVHLWGTAGSGTPQFLCCNLNGIGGTFGTYHTAAVLSTTDGSTTSETCFILDGTETGCAPDGASTTALQNFREYLIVWFGNFSVNEDLYIDHILVLSCGQETTQQCAGPIVTSYP